MSKAGCADAETKVPPELVVVLASILQCVNVTWRQTSELCICWYLLIIDSFKFPIHFWLQADGKVIS